MKNFHPDDNCPVRNVLCRLGDKWSMLVLITLNANGTMRFCDIHKTIADISQRMLTVTLRTLETDGLVSRRVYAEVPPRVEYELTERGKGKILIGHCAAGLLFDFAGITEGKRLAVHPLAKPAVSKGMATDEKSVVDGNFYTAQSENFVWTMMPQVIEALKK